MEQPDPIQPTGPSLRSGPRLTLGHAFALLLCFLLLVLLGLRKLDNSDVGFHLRMGEYILSNDGWPRTDPLTYTVPDHVYIDTSWGYQVLVASAHRLAGERGVVLLHAFFILIAFYVAFRTARRGAAEPTILVGLLLTAVLASEMRFEARPELLSLAMMSLLLHLLSRRAEGARAPLWLLPALFLVWANCHAFFLLGWIVAWSFIVGEGVGRRRFDRPLVRWTAVAGLICFVNPYGLHGILFPLTLLTRFDPENVFGRTILELTSPYSLKPTAQTPFIPVWSIYSFRLLAAISLLALPVMWRERRYGSILVWAIFFLLSARMVRNMAFFAVAVLPSVAPALSGTRAWHRLRWAGRPGENLARRVILTTAVLLAVALGLRVATGAYYADDRRAQRLGWTWNRLSQPVDAVAYLRRANLSGRMFNYLGFGGYLAWSQGSPVFIDGRLEVIGDSLYEEYLQILKSPDTFEAAASRYRFDWAIFPFAVAPGLLKGLSDEPGWRLAYYDHMAVVFVRSNAQAASFIDDAVVAPKRLSKIPIDSLPGLGGRTHVSPVRHWFDGLVGPTPIDREMSGRGLFHLIRGDFDDAEAALASVIQQNGGAYYELYFNLGTALYEEGRRKEAAACYRIVLEQDPDNPVARERAR